MAQKLVLCECSVGTDILQSQPLASYLAEGYEVVSAKGYSARDNRNMSLVLLEEPWDIQVATPVFGITSDGVLSISCSTPLAHIFYTHDGSVPGSEAMMYNPSVKPTLNSTTTIKAVTRKSGMADSDVATFVFTVEN